MPPPIQQPMAQAMPVQPNPAVGNMGVSPQPALNAMPTSPEQQAQEEQLMMQMLTPEQQSQLAAKKDSMSPEEWAGFVQQLTQNFTAMGGDAQQDMTRADALRQDSPQGRTTGSNQLYQAANPLEFLAAGLNNKKRQDEYAAGKAERTDARTRADAVREGAANDYIDRTTGG